VEAFPENQEGTLRSRTKRALGWRMGSIYTRFVLQWIVTIVFTRLLLPEDFGLLAQATIVVTLAATVSEVGMAPALIQKRDLTIEHIRTAFAISIISGLFLSSLLWLMAPLFEVLFASKGITPILRVLSWTFLLTSLSTTGFALLQRDLNFRSLFIIDTLSYIGYGIVGVVMALRGNGVWALVAAAVTQSALKVLITIAISRHSLRPKLHLEAARSLLRFGAGMSATRIIIQCSRTTDNFIVGRYLGAEALGYYSRAYVLMSLPIHEIAGAMNTVLFPAYAEIQDQHERVRRVYFENLSFVALRTFPVLITMSVLSVELMRGVYGPLWKPAATPLSILCIGGCFLCIYTLGDALARAKGALAPRFWQHLIFAIVVLALSRIGAQYGNAGVAVGVSIALFLQYLMMAHLANQLLESSWRQFWSAQIPGAIVAVLCGAVAYGSAQVMRALHWPDLVIAALSSLCVLAISLLLLFRLPAAWLPPAVSKMREGIRSKLAGLLSRRRAAQP
jgi:PST family polysaccharide transporter